MSKQPTAGDWARQCLQSLPPKQSSQRSSPRGAPGRPRDVGQHGFRSPFQSRPNLPTPANPYVSNYQIPVPRLLAPSSSIQVPQTRTSAPPSSAVLVDPQLVTGHHPDYDENSIFFPEAPHAKYTGRQYKLGVDPLLSPTKRALPNGPYRTARQPSSEHSSPSKKRSLSEISSILHPLLQEPPAVHTTKSWLPVSNAKDVSTSPNPAFSPPGILSPDDLADTFSPALMPEQDVPRRQPLSRNWSPAAAKSMPTIKKDLPIATPAASKMTPIAATPISRKGGPRQTSLMNFFGSSPATSAFTAPEALFYVESAKFNTPEDESPVKRRRVSEADEGNWVVNHDEPRSEFTSTPRRSQSSALIQDEAPQKSEKRRGGFIVDSDDSDDELLSVPNETVAPEPPPTLPTRALRLRPKKNSQSTDADEDSPKVQALDGTFDDARPPLMRQDTSLYTPGEFGDEDFTNEEFYEEGEEFMERRWMEEQAAMEAAFDEDSKSEDDTESVQTPKDDFDLPDATEQASVVLCPICSGSLRGLTEAQASSHVNACLDGTAPPLPTATEDVAVREPDSRPASPFKQPAKPAQRFQRAAIARPPQANPFNTAKDSKSGGSAFTRLMSGHAEDLAWAEAASNEKDSRGKPAYQRTCPFYKIMPGMYICVDAFRYGKVEGQNAYFLSHFHSDHYIGLTASWSHGPIYASKVTCNLMRQCLKVDPKWIRPLEFEKKYEIPDTNGVRVTMIPANHCPGSSLYLFEKVTGKNRDGSDRMHRLLHCGDFRACPAHVNHQLLRPNVVDAVTGATREQWIDTCYLDTTYLTPKYAFPSQSDIIDACAAMCVSLSNEIANPDDIWEQAKSVRMGPTMTKFLEAGNVTSVKPEIEEDDKSALKPRGRLLVVIGTYSIGKERICLGIAKALNSKIYAPPNKMAICRALEDKELNSRLTSNKFEAQVHMQILFEIRAETLHDYLVQHKPHFSRVVGFRPTGWNYKPPTSRFTENPAVDTILHSEGWKSRFSMKDLVPQRGSTKESNCFGVPYSEHSSFRELTMFCCALRIKKVIPTVNVGSAKGREKMKKWIEKWEAERRKKGLFEWKEKGGSGGEDERFEGLHYGV